MVLKTRPVGYGSSLVWLIGPEIGWTGGPTGSIQTGRFNYYYYFKFLQYQNDVVLEDLH